VGLQQHNREKRKKGVSAMVMWKVTRNISLCLPEELLVEIDEAAKAGYMSRSDYIRQILHREVIKLRAKPRYQAPQIELWKVLDRDDS
jgi:Arc/MetJ-type ribon-helix-helix transcriptional regulator